MISADAVYLVNAGRAVYEQVVAENAAAMRELSEARTQIAALGDQAPGANSEALRILVKAYGFDITKRKAADNGKTTAQP